LIDLNGHTVNRRDETLHLTPSEFLLLTILAQHPGQVFSREQLLERLYGVAYDGFARSVDAHVKNLRQKLEDNPADPRYVLTIYGIGYKFESGAEGGGEL
ncbi:MAG TPA: winged helix-turn-helix domain-containing protein, partial [Aggregatilineales bacterium]|nr:winged helix-turn-helix domain-containing protein [Aggregatilineales bacterium]